MTGRKGFRLSRIKYTVPNRFYHSGKPLRIFSAMKFVFEEERLKGMEDGKAGSRDAKPTAATLICAESGDGNS